jgi:hypothetical protein
MVSDLHHRKMAATKKFRLIGNVVIEDNVEIGCNSTIDRATVGFDIIHAGTKLDNLIQIALMSKLAAIQLSQHRQVLAAAPKLVKIQ